MKPHEEQAASDTQENKENNMTIEEANKTFAERVATLRRCL